MLPLWLESPLVAGLRGCRQNKHGPGWGADGVPGPGGSCRGPQLGLECHCQRDGGGEAHVGGVVVFCSQAAEMSQKLGGSFWWSIWGSGL